MPIGNQLAVALVLLTLALLTLGGAAGLPAALAAMPEGVTALTVLLAETSGT
jgi:hypothetical protein